MNAGIAVIVPIAIFLILDGVILNHARRKNSRTDSLQEKIFTVFAASVLVLQLTTVFWYMHEFGVLRINSATALYALNGLGVSFMSASAWMWLEYLFIVFYGKTNLTLRSTLLMSIPTVVIVIMSIATPWTGWFSIVHSDGSVSTGNAYFVQVVCAYSYLLIGVIAVIVETCRGRYHNIRAAMKMFFAFMLPALAGTAIQLLVLRGGYTQIGISFGLLLMYLNLFVEEVKKNELLRGVSELNSKLELQAVELERTICEKEKNIEEISSLNEQLGEVQEIISNVGFGIWHIILKDGCEPRMQANKKMLEILGIPERFDMSEEQVYAHWFNRIHPASANSVEKSVSEMLEGRLSENTYAWMHPQKGEIYVRCGGAAEFLSDGTSVIRGYHGDVTSIVLSEIESKKAILAAQKEAEEASAAKTRFLFNMSHDIRTPMNAIMGFADLMEKHLGDEEILSRYLSKIRISSMTLLSIINNVLEMARIEKGGIIIEESFYSVSQFTESVNDIFSESMRQKGIEFSIDANVTHDHVICDQVKIREIYLNLISNAFKYTESGGSVRVQIDELECEQKGHGLYRVTVSDTGIGMSAEFLPHIFEEFSREATTTESGIDGTGLGMAIVNRLVDLMGGTIQVESSLGVGTTITVTIAHRIAQCPDFKELLDEEIDPSVFVGKRVLLVEDNELNAEISQELLRELGLEVDTVSDGAMCLYSYNDSPAGYYDLILMDVQMPVMNGYEATKAIRALDDPEKAGIPILAMTANAFEEDKKEAREAGMNEHISKPINVLEMKKKIADAFNA